MSFLLAIEGADGAGKGTAAAAVAARLEEASVTVATFSFPRYALTAGGWVLGEYLGARLPRAVSPRAAAVLYALDRLESLGELTRALAEHEVVVLDRYIASNMVYQASQAATGEAEALMAWIVRLETEQFGLPVPDLSVYLDTPPALARELIMKKHRRSYTDYAFDTYEADAALQTRVRAHYAAIAGTQLLGRWATVSTARGNAMRPPADIADDVVRAALTAMEPDG